jgi:hypothetical protein
MSHLQLQSKLKFSVDDLRENRDGRISEKQHEKFKPPEVNRLVLWVLLGHAVFIGGLLGAIAIITGSIAAWVVLAIVMAFGMLPFVVMKNEGNITPLLRNDYESGKVKQACGIVILSEKKGRRIYYELYVDAVTLKITAKEAAAFIHEETYCIYYLPRSLKLISAEPTQV